MMIIKNLTKVAIAAFLGIAPGVGTEIKEFPDVKYSLRNLTIKKYLPVDKKVIIQGEQTSNDNNNTLNVEFKKYMWEHPIVETVFKNDDLNLRTIKIENVSVDCQSDNVLSKEFVLKSTPYQPISDQRINIVKDKRIPDSELPLYSTEVIEAYNVLTYLRKDDSIYEMTDKLPYNFIIKVRGEDGTEISDLKTLPLNTLVNVYKEPSNGEDKTLVSHLIREENKSQRPQLTICTKEERETQYSFKKLGSKPTRHWCNVYNCTEQAMNIYKVLLDGTKILLPGFTESLLLLQLVSEDKHDERKNRPDCPGKNWPTVPFKII